MNDQTQETATTTPVTNEAQPQSTIEQCPHECHQLAAMGLSDSSAATRIVGKCLHCETHQPQEEIQPQVEANTDGTESPTTNETEVSSTNTPVQTDTTTKTKCPNCEVPNPSMSINEDNTCSLCGRDTTQPIIEPITNEQIEEIKHAPAMQGQVVEVKDEAYSLSAGRPTKYNQDMQQKARAYLDSCIKQKATPYVEALALELDVDEDTVGNWAHKHTEFFGTIKRLKLMQKLRLKQRAVAGKGNNSGSIFLLKAEHGLIETEKQIITPDKNININITRE